MATEKQITANRRNAAKSTGPKTFEGKKVARLNAMKHGLQADQVLIPGENPEEFEALLSSLEEYYNPVGPVENVLVERIAYCTWRLRRLSQIEAAIMREQHVEIEEERARSKMWKIRSDWNYGSDDCDLEEPDPAYADGVQAYAEALRDCEEARRARDQAKAQLESGDFALAVVFRQSTKDLETLSRYETTIERQLRNAMQDLERLQFARADKAAEAATVIDVKDLNRDAS